MRKVILCLAVSFDGFIEGPNGELDWIVFDKDGGSDLMSFVEEIDSIFYGRVSYEMWGNPPITDESSDFERSFYGALAKMNRYQGSWRCVPRSVSDPSSINNPKTKLQQ